MSQSGAWKQIRRALRSGGMIAVLCVVISHAWLARAQPPNDSGKQIDFAARAKKTFLMAQNRYRSETNSEEAAWQFARACFDLGEFATSNAERAEVAQTGITVADRLIVRHPALAPAHYYLAMNLGQLARTRSLGALRLVDQMEVEFSAALRLDPHFDFAGPDRNLGLLYLEAPSFASIGSRAKARLHLRRAVELEPDYPENRLQLIEAYLRWGDRNSAVREFKILAGSWPLAHQKFTGDEWALSWIDWEKRHEKLKEKIEEDPRQLAAPRGKN